MKLLYWLVPVLLLAAGFAPRAGARAVHNWSNEELLAKADVVVIATAVESRDTSERREGLYHFPGQPVVGVETIFNVERVLKGDARLQHLVLHHYRADGMKVPNAPSFLTFEEKSRGSYRLFLVREADGRFQPVTGQVDPEFSVQKAEAR